MPEDRYFVLMGESQVGPLGIQQVRNMRNAGTIKEDTLLWREGDPEWLPSTAFKAVLDDEVTEVSAAEAAPATPEPIPAEPEPIPAEPEPIPAEPAPMPEAPQLDTPEPMPAAPPSLGPAPEPVQATPEARPSMDPEAPKITPSGIWREIEADRDRKEAGGESSVDQIASSADEPTTDEPEVPGACPSCGAELRYCPVCGQPIHAHEPH